jgi:UDP-glucuronate 4-epimerase
VTIREKTGAQSILVTGAAGFIGFHLCQRLLRLGYGVIGLDNLNPYYDVTLKQARLTQLVGHPRFKFHSLDLIDRMGMADLFATYRFDRVVNLAAQAGVRYSLENPHIYVESNVMGFLNILEGCRQTQVPHLLFASSSSVYGSNTQQPFSEHHPTDHPVSLYAATKKANEMMAHTYSHLYQIPTTGLRFFTVYGPWGRPDMALFLFTRSILAGEPIKVFNYGKMQRDFTYIDDVVEGIVRTLNHIPQANPGWDSHQPDPASSSAPYRLYNLGNHQPVELLQLIELLESALGKPANKQLLPLQAGEVLLTYADTQDLFKAVQFRPSTSLKEGVQRFVDWYLSYYPNPTALVQPTPVA